MTHILSELNEFTIIRKHWRIYGINLLNLHLFTNTHTYIELTY